MPSAPQALPASPSCILASASSLNSMRPCSPPAPPPASPYRSPVAYCMLAGCGAPRRRHIERRRGFLTAARRRPACASSADGRLRIRKRHCRAVRPPIFAPRSCCASTRMIVRTRRRPLASSLPSRATQGCAGFARSCTRPVGLVRPAVGRMSVDFLRHGCFPVERFPRDVSTETAELPCPGPRGQPSSFGAQGALPGLPVSHPARYAPALPIHLNPPVAGSACMRGGGGARLWSILAQSALQPPSRPH